MVKGLLAWFVGSLVLILAAQSTSAKANATAVWQRIAVMEKNKEFGTIRVDADVNISNHDIKVRFGAPTKVSHYKVGHPPSTGSIWLYKRANGTLEFRFFSDTRHVNQIELKRS